MVLLAAYLTTTRAKGLLLSVSVLLTLLTSCGATAYWMLKDPLRAITTETRMRDLMRFLETERPERVDPESLRSVLTKYKRLDCPEDGWGRLLVIELLAATANRD